MHTSILADFRPRLLTALCLWALTFFALATPGYAAGPVVSGASLSPATLPVTGVGPITVTATVTSAQAITSVKAFIYQNGAYTGSAVVMSNGGSGNVYTGTFSVGGNNTTSADYVYTCSVTATDSASQSNSALTGTLTKAHDNTPPTITVTSFTPPTLPVTGGGMKVTATVTDPGSRPISTVKAFLYLNGAYTGSAVAMSNGGSGNVYTGTFSTSNNTTSADYVYSAVITATDDLGLASNATVGQTVQAHDNTPPTITATGLSPATLPYTGGGITVTATVTDPGSRPISAVKAFLYLNGAYTGSAVAMSNGGSGNVYTGTFASGSNTTNAAYTYTAVVTATDDLGLANSANVAGKSVQGYNGPTPSLIPLLYTTAPTAPVLSPASVAAGGPDLPLKINGVNFVSGAVALFNGVALAPTSITGTQVTVNIPAALIALPGSYAVSVLAPSPGSASNSVNLIVTSANADTTHILWNNSSGLVSVWNVDKLGNVTNPMYGPFTGWTAKGIADGPDGKTRVLWDKTDGTMRLWSLDTITGDFTQNTYGPYAGWTATAISAGP